MGEHDKQVPLWQQLQRAAQVVAEVRRGVSATAALAQVEPGWRPGVQALAYQALRQLGWAQAVRSLLAPRKPQAGADALLCTALALLRQEAGAAYDDHTLVNQAVEAAKHSRALRPQAGFLNACLRRYLREREPLAERVQGDPQAQWNCPSWWITQLQADHPQHWQAILQAQNLPPPMTLRVNRRHGTVADYLARLQQAGIAAQACGQDGVRLARARPVQDLPGFAQGDVSVQDEAAQRAAPLLLQGPLAEPGRRVLDACAAPGGKTAHLLECADVEVLALDIDATRCARIRENLDRLGLQAELQVADAAQPANWWDGRGFDAILLDAPCTASGIVRRHPDVRWLRRPTDVGQLARAQAALLAALWPMLLPGGRLLYCTCSVFRAEGDGQIKTFLAHNTDARLLPSPGHLLPESMVGGHAVPDNGVGDHDGFYYALLEKNKA